MVDKNIINRHPTFVAVALFLNFVVLSCMAGYLLIENFRGIEKKHAFENLHSIGNLKVGQIQAYLGERKSDAIISSKLLSNAQVQHWLKNPSKTAPLAVRQSLEAVVSTYQFGGGAVA